jgi:hypothetical protein
MSFSFLNDIDWSDRNTINIAIIVVTFSIMLILKGLRKLKNEHTTRNQNTPASKADTGAIGTKVEFEGKIVAEDKNLVTAPLSGKKCVLYHIQMGEADHEDDPWDIIDEYFSADAFFLEDQNGAKALVYLKGADLRHREEPEKISPGSYDCPTLPEPIWQSLQENKHKLIDWDLESPTWFVDGEIRIAEWCFMPDEQIQIRRFDNQSNEAMSIEKPEDLTKSFAGIYSKEKFDELLPKTNIVFKCKQFSPLIICKQPEKRSSQHTWEATEKLNQF